MGGVAVQHDHSAEPFGHLPGACGRPLDQLHLEVVLQRLGHSGADVAAPCNHDVAHVLRLGSERREQGPDVVRAGDEVHVVAVLDDGPAVDGLGVTGAVHGGDPPLDLALPKFGGGSAHQPGAGPGLGAQQQRPAIGKLQYLRGAGEADELLHVTRNQVFRSDGDVHRQSVRAEQRGDPAVFGVTQARNLGAPPCAGLELAVARMHDLAGHHVHFVVAGNGDHQVRGPGPGVVQDPGPRGVAGNGAHVHAFVYGPQDVGVEIHDRDLVFGFAGKTLGDRGAHDAGPEDQYLHLFKRMGLERKGSAELYQFQARIGHDQPF